VSDNQWTPYATVQDILGLGRETWPVLSRALRLGQVRSQGKKAEDPDGEAVDIPPDHWAEWNFSPAQGRLTPPNIIRTRVPVGFVQVRFSRQDVEKLARSLRQTSTRARTPSLAAEGGSRAGASLEAKAGKEIAVSPPKQAPQSASDTANARNMTPAEIGRAGGKMSGKVRLAGRKWVPHATELAEAAVKREPAASHERVANMIADNWKRDDVRCPQPRTLARWVSQKRARGELPPRSGSSATRSASRG
jgi:hypothetical protein